MSNFVYVVVVLIPVPGLITGGETEYVYNDVIAVSDYFDNAIKNMTADFNERVNYRNDCELVNVPYDLSRAVSIYDVVSKTGTKYRYLIRTMIKV